MRLTDSGNLGIGTSTPTTFVQLKRTTGAMVEVDLAGATGTSQLAHNNSGGVLRLNRESDNVMNSILRAYGDTSLNIAVGNVGIGTATPAAKLDVAGDARINGLTLGRGAGDVTTNSALGASALVGNTTGSFNATVGYQAMLSNTTGFHNTAVGGQALYNNTTGNNAAAVGLLALYYSTGTGNTAVGSTAGHNASNDIAQFRVGADTYMTLLGFGATKDNASALTNGVAIGANAHVLQSNQVVLGNDSITTTLLKGSVGIGTTTPTARLQVNGDLLVSDNGAGNLYGQATLYGGAAGSPALAVLGQQGVISDGVIRIDGYGGGYTGYIKQKVDSSGTLQFIQNGNLGLAINSTGNVGVGTAAPAYKLDVFGGLRAGDNSSTSGSVILVGNYSGEALNVLGAEYSSGATVLAYGVKPSNSAAGTFLSSVSPQTYRSVFVAGGAAGFRFYTGPLSTTAVDSAVSLNEVMRLTNAGSLGIGTSAPTQALHVAGNARITGALYDSADSPGSAGQVLTSTATGTAWQNAATALGGTLFAQGGNSFAATATLGTNDAFNLVFRTNAVERMRLDTSGNLGLGSTSPGAKLHIAGAPATFGSVKAQLVLENNTTAYNASPVSGLAFVNPYTSGGASTTMGGITVGRYTATSGDTSAYMAFHVKDNSNNLLERMRIDWAGGLAINSVSAGSYQLYVAGTAAATSFTSLSDARFKRDVTPLRMALARVGQLRGVSYRWRRDEFPDRAFDDKPQIGFIAQELEQVLPEVVNTSTDGFKSVAYTGVIPVVVEAVKELHTLIGPLLPFAQVADKLQLSKDTLTLEIKAPVKIGGDLLVAGDVTAVSLKAKKVVADEVQAGKLQAGSVQSGNLQAARVTTGELGMVLDGGTQQDLLDLPLQASYTVVVSGPDGSFVHATVLNTGGLIQITAKHLNGLDLLATGTRLRVVNTSVQTKRLNASWTRVG
jgi:hypothetical protein